MFERYEFNRSCNISVGGTGGDIGPGGLGGTPGISGTGSSDFGDLSPVGGSTTGQIGDGDGGSNNVVSGGKGLIKPDGSPYNGPKWPNNTEPYIDSSIGPDGTYYPPGGGESTGEFTPGGGGDFGVESVEFDPSFLFEMRELQEQLAREGLELAETSFGEAAGFQQPFYGDAAGLGAFRQGIMADEFSALDPRHAFTFDPSDPEYQQLLQSGVGAIDAAASARGGLMAGSRAKDLTSFGQGLANTFAGDVLNRRRAVAGDRFSQLGTLASVEQAAANNLSNIYTGLGQLQAGTLSGLGTGALNVGQAASQLGLQSSLANASNALQSQQLANQYQLGLLDYELGQEQLAAQIQAAEDARPSTTDQLLSIGGNILGGYLGGLF